MPSLLLVLGLGLLVSALGSQMLEKSGIFRLDAHEALLWLAVRSWFRSVRRSSRFFF